MAISADGTDAYKEVRDAGFYSVFNCLFIHWQWQWFILIKFHRFVFKRCSKNVTNILGRLKIIKRTAGVSTTDLVLSISFYFNTLFRPGGKVASRHQEPSLTHSSCLSGIKYTKISPIRFGVLSWVALILFYVNSKKYQIWMIFNRCHNMPPLSQNLLPIWRPSLQSLQKVSQKILQFNLKRAPPNTMLQVFDYVLTPLLSSQEFLRFFLQLVVLHNFQLIAHRVWLIRFFFLNLN